MIRVNGNSDVRVINEVTKTAGRGTATEYAESVKNNNNTERTLTLSKNSLQNQKILRRQVSQTGLQLNNPLI